MSRGPVGLTGFIATYPIAAFAIAAVVVIYFSFPTASSPTFTTGSDPQAAGGASPRTVELPPPTRHSAGKVASVQEVLRSRGCDARAAVRYGLMLDAGSTGSRIHVFEFDYSRYPQITLKREVFEELRPGLSSYNDDATAAANSLKPLMAVAVREVPKELARCTPVELKATAGLRLLGAAKSQNILAAVDKLLRAYDFAVGADAAIVMDGRDEGPYAWLTVNFLLGTLQADSTTSAVIDMGGASTQIVFVPDAGSDVLSAASVKQHRYDIALATGATFKLYQHSHLGYGLKESFKAIEKLAPSVTEAGGLSAPFSCRYPGADFDGCLPFAIRHLRSDRDCAYAAGCSFNGVFQPPLVKHKGPIYAFSYYYDRLEAFLPPSGVTTVGFVQEVGRGVCKGDTEAYKAHAKGSMCTDLAYLYALLSRGYGLSDATNIIVKKKINDIETAWPLGAMILVM